MKDNFSIDSNKYAKYRPAYPQEFFEYLSTIKTGSENAWDCGTGNGQVAEKLAGMFTNVYATDISQAQLENAAKLPNIIYSVQPAEKTDFKPNFFDLIIVAQAVHWFDFERFYSEVKRTAKCNSLLAIIGYARLKITQELDKLIDKLYFTIVGNYWDKERKYVDDEYRTIPYPFEELAVPDFKNCYTWTFEHLIGYLGTWSAVKHYIKEIGKSPIELVYEDLRDSWGQTEKRVVSFPLLLRIGKIKTSADLSV
jgi:ubiquinone/menaquinone biosynthesis C-methylase UbiE